MSFPCSLLVFLPGKEVSVWQSVLVPRLPHLVMTHVCLNLLYSGHYFYFVHWILELDKFHASGVGICVQVLVVLAFTSVTVPVILSGQKGKKIHCWLLVLIWFGFRLTYLWWTVVTMRLYGLSANSFIEQFCCCRLASSSLWLHGPTWGNQIPLTDSRSCSAAFHVFLFFNVMRKGQGNNMIMRLIRGPLMS